MKAGIRVDSFRTLYCHLFCTEARLSPISESPIETTGLLRSKVACLWIYIYKIGPLQIFPTSFCGPSWILYEQ